MEKEKREKKIVIHNGHHGMEDELFLLLLTRLYYNSFTCNCNHILEIYLNLCISINVSKLCELNWVSNN